MVYKQTIVKICDNTGIDKVRCIENYLSKKSSTGAILGKVILGSTYRIKKRTGKIIRKGLLNKILLVRTKKPYIRVGGDSLKFLITEGIILTSGLVPIGTRMWGPTINELRFFNPKLLSMVLYLI